MQEKPVVLLQNQNSSTRERVVLKSKMFATFRGKKKTLSSIKNQKIKITPPQKTLTRSGHPCKTTLLDDSRMLSTVKRKAFTISTQFKNTPQLPFQFIHYNVQIRDQPRKARLGFSYLKSYSTFHLDRQINVYMYKALVEPSLAT